MQFVAVLDYLQQAKQTGIFPCLIVLDLNMPKLNGKETLARLKQDPTFKHIPTVVFTTFSSLPNKQFCASYAPKCLPSPLPMLL